MPVDRKITKELNMVKNLQSLTIVYEEIAVMRINTTKASVLQTRAFLDKLSRVFLNIKLSYQHQLLHTLQGKKHHVPIEVHGTKKNGKEAHVLLSANNKMYGDIISHVFEAFFLNIQSPNVDVVILGEVGKSLYQGKNSDKPFQYFPLSDISIDFQELRPILTCLKAYEKVFIYYGKFKSMLIQEPAISDISGNQPFESKEDDSLDAEPFLFEPNLTHVHETFETQIFYALFKQTLHEISLARFASRIKAMEKTSENIYGRVKHLEKKEKRINYLIQSKKQLQQLAQMRFVKKRRSYAAGNHQ